MLAVRGRLLVGVAVVAALAVAGCSAGDDSGGNASQGAAQEVAAGQPGAEQDPAGAQQAQPGNAAPAQLRQESRSIIYTGEITVRVEDVDRAAARVGALADGAGGFVAGDKRSSNEEQSEAHLTLRVPAERFIATVDELARLGEEESRGISTEDVTQQVVDLDAQIASQNASVERTRALLARAQSIGEIVSIEAELAKRESALATLEARKRRLADLTALSTVTVHLITPEAAASRDAGFLTGLDAGATAFLGAMIVILTIIGFLLPFLVVIGLPVALVWRLLRRRRAAAGSDLGVAAGPELPSAS